VIVLGIDPGTLVMGYGIIESSHGKIRLIACDAIVNNGAQTMPQRLKRIYDTLTAVIERYHPDEVAIETAFYGKNAQSALKLGHARGVAMLAAVTRDVPTSEYSPREVKKAIVGKGNASKQQVQYMVGSLLMMKKLPKVYDASDALAVAICHLHRNHRSQPLYRTWKAFVEAHPSKISRKRNFGP
jgi:crossover junction endodeoxyribonuclease RuvC